MPRPAVVRRAAARLLSDAPAAGAQEADMALRARRPGALDALAQHYGTDKSSTGHGYTSLYKHHFGRRRLTVRSVLEIGVGGTTSREGYETSAGGQSLSRS